jgi:hypothetical protein
MRRIRTESRECPDEFLDCQADLEPGEVGPGAMVGA